MRLNEPTFNSSQRHLYIIYSEYIVPDFSVNNGLRGSNGSMSRPLFSHSPKFHASFYASGKYH